MTASSKESALIVFDIKCKEGFRLCYFEGVVFLILSPRKFQNRPAGEGIVKVSVH